MINIIEPTIPEEIEEVLLEVRKETERATRNDVWWSIKDVFYLAEKHEKAKKWFDEKPENRDEFFIAFMYSYKVKKEIFHLIYKFPDFIDSVGAEYLSYDSYFKKLTLSNKVNAINHKTIFNEDEVKRLGIDMKYFKKEIL